MKLLRNKFFYVIAILALTIVLMAAKLYIEKAASNVDVQKSIFVVAKNLETKHQITSEDLKQIQISQLSLPDGYVDSAEDIIGKFLINPVSKGSFIIKNNVTDEKFFEKDQIAEGYSMISLALNIDQAVGWKINKDQSVKLVYSPFQQITTIGNASSEQDELTSIRVIEDITIVDVINEALISYDDKEFAGVPKYVVIMAKNKDAEFISLAKEKGRFEIIVNKN
ncbi:MAG: flagella basal body P-ring formation protein FlgA [Clostridia bacterium]|nr:flagella basal body P-ring formation protein FlgA [Clostridia bacterium]